MPRKASVFSMLEFYSQDALSTEPWAGAYAVLWGIGNTLENDVKHMHQISARIKSRVSQMKNKGQQAYVHSKIEVIQNCAMLVKIEESWVAAEWVTKNQNPEICATSRAKKAKIEREIKGELKH